MATTRAFIYNKNGLSISGTELFGQLSVGYPTSVLPGGLVSWNGPDEELGYVIAKTFSFQPTPIFTGDPLTLSTVYKPVDINLTNGDKTAYVDHWGYTQTILSDTLIDKKDKIMFSLTFSSTNPGVMFGAYIGVGTRSMNYNSAFGSFPGTDNQSVGFTQDGTYYYNGAVQATGLPTWISGSTIDIAIDLESGNKIWIRVGGGSWNNDPGQSPESGICGLTMSGLNKIYPALCPGSANGSSYGSMTLLDTPPYDVPSGFQFLGTNLYANVKFMRSSDLTDQSFINLVNSKFSQNFTSAIDADVWVKNQGHWTSYVKPILSLDAGNILSFTQSNQTIWTDTVAGKTFSLINGASFSTNSGGLINFDASSSQYAECSTSLPNVLTQWSVGVWHYYDGTTSTGSPCIITEVFPTAINYVIGNTSDSSPFLQTGFFNGNWNSTPQGYQLTPNNWYYIASTYDGLDIKLYVNNVLIYDVSCVTTPTSGNNGILLMKRWDLPEFWGGHLAKIDIYDKALNPGNVNLIWNSNKSRFGL